MKTKNFGYWACQIAGWGAYTAVGFTTAVMHTGWLLSTVIGYLLLPVYSIALTHLLRKEIRRGQWTALSPVRALPRFAAAVVLIAAIQSALVVGVYYTIEGRLGIWAEDSAIGYMFLGLTMMNGIWVTLYLTVTTAVQTRDAGRKEVQMTLALKNAELRALEAQLNPHFLFNCLNSIRGMITEDAPQAQDMVTRLANILRYALQRDRHHTVQLSSEVETVSDYLALESIRFEDRLRVHLAIDQAASSSPIPPMLLQTLVENAIKHGVEETPAGGELFIRAAIHASTLRIEVENTGVLCQPKPGATGIGLANARERLRILYGDFASLQLKSSGEGRVIATILIPAAA